MTQETTGRPLSPSEIAEVVTERRALIRRYVPEEDAPSLAQIAMIRALPEWQEIREHATERNEALVVARLEFLLEALDFVETEEMLGVKGSLIKAAAAGKMDEAKERMTQYQLSAEGMVDDQSSKGFGYAGLQIGRSIATGLIRRRIGSIDRYTEDLKAARTYAMAMDYREVAEIITTTLANN